MAAWIWIRIPKPDTDPKDTNKRQIITGKHKKDKKQSNWYNTGSRYLFGVQNVMNPNPLDRLVAGSFMNTTSATYLFGVQNVMNPNPLDRLVAGSFITITSATSPNCEKYSRTF
jgi:hypothetical protein